MIYTFLYSVVTQFFFSKYLLNNNLFRVASAVIS
jgi:hypothetical protein